MMDGIGSQNEPASYDDYKKHQQNDNGFPETQTLLRLWLPINTFSMNGKEHSRPIHVRKVTFPKTICHPALLVFGEKIIQK